MLKQGATRWYLLSALVIVLDQFTKYLITSAFHLGEVHPITPFFNLVLTYNQGAAFSLLATAGGWQRIFFTVLALVVSGVIVRLLQKHHGETRFAAALALIMGGALGNVIDRLLLGHVIDFIQVYYSTHFFPAFNVADSGITIGAGLLVLDSMLKKPVGNPAA